MRHGETEWSLIGRHTGRTDVPLTTRGEEQARQLGLRLSGLTFSHVLTSPRQRARQTCELAGLAGAAEIVTDLSEWDYGDYEGLTSAEIRAGRPSWNIYVDGAPGGESPADVLSRAQRVVARVESLEGNVAVFSHGHFLRVLAIAWTRLSIVDAARFGLSTGSHGILGYDSDRRERPVVAQWNAV